MKLYLYGDKGRGVGGLARDGAEELLRVAVADFCGDEFCAGLGDEAFAVARGPHGKPRFSAPPLRGRVHFSVSHSGGHWGVLIHGAAVGFDVEDLNIRRKLTTARMERIAARFFAEDEVKYLKNAEGRPLRTAEGKIAELCEALDRARPLRADGEALPARGDFSVYPAAPTRFFEIWTAKEAYVKYTGGGIAEGLNTFSVFDPPGGAAISTFSPVPGFICSCCAKGSAGFPEVVYDKG